MASSDARCQGASVSGDGVGVVNGSVDIYVGIGLPKCEGLINQPVDKQVVEISHKSDWWCGYEVVVTHFGMQSSVLYGLSRQSFLRKIAAFIRE